MSIPITQNQKCFRFCDLPKGERLIQFIFRNETNQPLCDLFIKLVEPKLISTCSIETKDALIQGHDSRTKHCDCPKCKSKKQGHKKCDCDKCRSVKYGYHKCEEIKEDKHDHHPICDRCHREKCACGKCKCNREKCKCGHHHHKCERAKKKHCHKPHGPRIEKVKVQTTFCAELVEWCKPRRKVCIDFQDIFYGKCIPQHAPNNLFIVIISFDKPLCGGEELLFETGSGYAPVVINAPYCC